MKTHAQTIKCPPGQLHQRPNITVSIMLNIILSITVSITVSIMVNTMVSIDIISRDPRGL